MLARTSVLVGSPPLACVKDMPTSSRAPIPLLSHSARRGRQWDASLEQANPLPKKGGRNFASDPYWRPRSLAAADHRAPDPRVKQVGTSVHKGARKRGRF